MEEGFGVEAGLPSLKGSELWSSVLKILYMVL